MEKPLSRSSVTRARDHKKHGTRRTISTFGRFNHNLVVSVKCRYTKVETGLSMAQQQMLVVGTRAGERRPSQDLWPIGQ